MPTRRQASPQPSPEPNLIVQREIAKERISSRIQQGEELVTEFQNANASTHDEYHSIREKYTLWNNYNGEMIRRQLFDAPKYADDYMRVYATLAGNSSLLEDMSDLVSDTKRQLGHLRSLQDYLEVIPLAETMSSSAAQTPCHESKNMVTIFIGHGGSPLWREIADYLGMFKKIQVINYESSPRAGFATKEVLEEMMGQASMGFIIHTAEDEAADAEIVRARENVIHEAGLFQGRLGFRRAIILLEGGCHEYSNIDGLGQIRFPKGNIKQTFGEVIATITRQFPYALAG